MSLLVLQLLIQTLITRLSGKWSWVFEGHTVECSESHNWDLMVRGRSLIDPCWSALNRTINRGLLTMQHSHVWKHCKWKWQQPLCWSCCRLLPWRDDGDGLVTHFYTNPLPSCITAKQWEETAYTQRGSLKLKRQRESGVSVPAERRSTHWALGALARWTQCPEVASIYLEAQRR